MSLDYKKNTVNDSYLKRSRSSPVYLTKIALSNIVTSYTKNKDFLLRNMSLSARTEERFIEVRGLTIIEGGDPSIKYADNNCKFIYF